MEKISKVIRNCEDVNERVIPSDRKNNFGLKTEIMVTMMMVLDNDDDYDDDDDDDDGDDEDDDEADDIADDY